jgi:hypothetical protein
MTVETRVSAPAVRGPDEPTPHVDSRLFWSWVWQSVYPALGWILIGAGAIVILLAWWGVSRNAIVAKQLPYLASGGIGGLALVALGGRYMVIRDLRHDSGRLDRLEQMVRELHDVLLLRAERSGVSTAHGAADIDSTTSPEKATAKVFALPRGGRYHRADCRVLANKTGVTPATAELRKRRGLEPCPLCEPDVGGKGRR